MGVLNFLSGPGNRWRRDVEEDIEAELEFHLEAKTAELVEEGWPPETARRKAEAAFGDRRRVLSQCRKERIGDRILLHRILAAAVIVLAATVGVLGFTLWSVMQVERDVEASSAKAARPPDRGVDERSKVDERLSGAAERPRDEPVPADQTLPAPFHADERLAGDLRDWRSWQARLQQLDADASARDCLAYSTVLVSMPPDISAHILPRAYALVTSSVARRALIEPFLATRDQTNVLAFLALAVDDKEPAVQTWALRKLTSYSLQDFTQDVAAYRAWTSEFRQRPINEVVSVSAQRYFDRLQRLADRELLDALDLFSIVDVTIQQGTDENVCNVLRNAGAWQLVHVWLTTGDVDLRARALDWAEHVGADEDLLRDEIRPQLFNAQRLDERTFGKLCRLYAVTARGAALADFDALARTYVANAPLVTQTDSARLRSAVRAMGETEDSRAIPLLLELLADRDDVGMRVLVGQALSGFTGVPADPTRGIEFWREWTSREENQQRMKEQRSANFPGRR